MTVYDLVEIIHVKNGTRDLTFSTDLISYMEKNFFILINHDTAQMAIDIFNRFKINDPLINDMTKKIELNRKMFLNKELLEYFINKYDVYFGKLKEGEESLTFYEYVECLI